MNKERIKKEVLDQVNQHLLHHNNLVSIEMVDTAYDDHLAIMVTFFYKKYIRIKSELKLTDDYRFLVDYIFERVCQNISQDISQQVIEEYNKAVMEMKEKKFDLDVNVALPYGQKYAPQRGSADAAGDDLRARKIEYLSPTKVKIHLGVHFEFSSDWEVLLLPRSNSGKSSWILSNCVGLGDPDYRGEYLAIFDYTGPYEEIQYEDGNVRAEIEQFPYEEGNRVVQCIFQRNYKPKYNIVSLDDMTKTERGSGGHGSTGLD